MKDEPDILGGLHDADVQADRDVVIGAAATGVRARAKQVRRSNYTFNSALTGHSSSA